MKAKSKNLLVGASLALATSCSTTPDLAPQVSDTEFESGGSDSPQSTFDQGIFLKFDYDTLVEMPQATLPSDAEIRAIGHGALSLVPASQQ